MRLIAAIEGPAVAHKILTNRLGWPSCARVPLTARPHGNAAPRTSGQSPAPTCTA